MGKHVHFNDYNPVTEISKPLAPNEEVLFVQLECHMRRCSLCRINDPSCTTSVQLCGRGHRLANHIGRAFFCKNGKLYYVREHGRMLMRAEVFPTHQYIYQALIEFERSLQVPSQVLQKSSGKRRYTREGTSSSPPCGHLRTAISLPSSKSSTMITTTTMTSIMQWEETVTRYYRFECCRVRRI
jgi:hypothetical protein